MSLDRESHCLARYGLIEKMYLDARGDHVVWEVPSSGVLDIEFEYEPRPPTELCLANQTGASVTK